MKNRVELRFSRQIVAFLWEAVIGADAGKGLPRRGDTRFIALNDDFLIFPVVHHRGGKLRERAVRVFEDRGAEVFHLGIVVRHVGHHCHDLRREAEHPLDGVDMMDRVVKRAATSLFFPGATPPQVVIAVSAPPERIHLRMADFPREAGIQRCF